MRTILIQLDTDPHPSTFDRVVAVDAGVDELFSYGGVTTENVTTLVHGAMFTRGPKELHHTAIFIGGSEVVSAEALLAKVQQTMFPPLTVSVMLDANGSNTTAAAAVLSARKHLDFSETRAVVLGGTGPVGLRVAQLLASEGCDVALCSRSEARAEMACRQIREVTGNGHLTPVGATDADGLLAASEGRQLLVAAGAPGVQFFSEAEWQSIEGLRVAIDLNAVDPVGLEGIAVHEKAVEKHGVICYGAIGVGGLKMKIHRAAIEKLFTANDLLLDAAAIYELGIGMLSK